MVVSPSIPFNRRMSIRACTPPSHVSAARAHMIRKDEGPRQDTCRGPCDCPAVQRNGPFKMRCERFPVRGPRADPALDYRAAVFFFLAGAAAAPFGAGHGAW